MSDEFSILLLKPDVQRLDEDSRYTLRRKVNDIVNLPGKDVLLSRDHAQIFWGESVSRFSWAEQYFELMSGVATFFKIEGKESARNIKGMLRGEFATQIEDLKRRLKIDFQPDLIHGSDPGDELTELLFLENIYKNRR